MSRELLYRKLLETQQQIAKEKRRRLELCTEVIINIFVGTGGGYSGPNGTITDVWRGGRSRTETNFGQDS